MNGRWKLLAGLALVVPTFVACDPPEPDQEIEFRVQVVVREVESGAVEDRIVATGSLRASEVAALRADTAGALVIGRNGSGRRLAEGDWVEAGQTIAEITGEEVRLAARSEATYQRYETAKRDYERKNDLFDEGLISEQEFRPVQDTLADAKLEWERSVLTETRSKLVTPISGLILRLARDENDQPLPDGQLVSQGYVAAQIAPTDHLIADVDLVGRDVARAAPGQSTRVRHHALKDEFDGEVIRLAPEVDPMTRTLRAEVRVDNRERKLRPGMFVEVTMVVDRREDVIVAPREAVTERGGKKVVFVLNGQRVDRRDVKIGLGDDDIVEILNGVEKGERIVVRGLETLTDGTRVRVSGA